MSRPDPNAPKYSRFILLASICVIVAGLYLAREVLIPLVLAMLLSFLLSPLVSLLERWKLHRVPSLLVVTAFALAVVMTVGYLVYDQAGQLANDLPAYKGNILAKMEGFPPFGHGVISR